MDREGVREVYEEIMALDIDRLRKDMRDECLGAYFVGGYGAALMEMSDVDRATPEQLIEMARRQGISLRKYQRKT